MILPRQSSQGQTCKPTAAEIKKAAAAYAKRGYTVLIYAQGSKNPNLAGWHKIPYRTPEQLEKLIGEGGVNLGILTGAPSGLLLLDMDAKVIEDEFCAIWPELAKTRLHRTPGAGLHHFLFQWGAAQGEAPNNSFKVEMPMPTGMSVADFPKSIGGFTVKASVDKRGKAKLIIPLADFRGDGGQIVAPPSVHPNGGLYTVARDIEPLPITLQQVKAIRKWLTERAKEARRFIADRLGVQLEAGGLAETMPAEEELESALAAIDPEDMADGQLWMTIGYGIKNWNAGERGKRLWVKWCMRWPEFSEGEPERRWNGMSAGGGTTYRTIFWMARQRGWRGEQSQSRPHPSAEAEAADDGLPWAFLPGGARHVRIRECAQRLGELLGRTELVLMHGGRLVKIKVDETGRPTLDPVSPAALASLCEAVASLRTTALDRSGRMIERPRNLTESEAKLIAASQPFQQRLAPLKLLTRCPVLIERDGQLAVIQGYDRASGVYVHGGRVEDVPLEEAKSLILELFEEFDFVSPADLSRAVAGLITPALVHGDLLGGRAPLDLAEANASQSGKGFRHKLTAAVYNDFVESVTQRERGVGGLEESFSDKLVRGSAFISIDNVRGPVNSPAIESALTEDTFHARPSFHAGVTIDMRRVVVMMTTNGANLTTDLANRTSPVAIRKEPEGYQFRRHPEGTILDHVRADQGLYLGAVFAIIRAWRAAGSPQTGETRHDFRPWSQKLDWIVQKIFGLAPLCDGLRETKARMSNPALAWLRAVALAVERAARCGQWLRAAMLAEGLHAAEAEVPGLGEGEDLCDPETTKRVQQAIGRKMALCFRCANPGQETLDGLVEAITLDGFVIERRSTYDPERRCDTRLYRFQRAAMTGPGHSRAIAAGEDSIAAAAAARDEASSTRAAHDSTCGYGGDFCGYGAAIHAANEPPAAANAANDSLKPHRDLLSNAPPASGCGGYNIESTPNSRIAAEASQPDEDEPEVRV